MKNLYLLFILSFCVFSSQAQNTCDSALEIVAGTHTVDLVDGSEIPLPVCTFNGPGADAGEWYSYTPSSDTSVTVSTDLNVNYGIDTRFQVYTGNCGNLTCHSGDDDSGVGFLSIATFEVIAGVNYYIAFDNRWDSDGFEFILTEGEVEEEEEEVPQDGFFTANSISVSGSTYGVVDMNGDFLDDVVAVSANNINIHHQNPDVPGGLTNINIPTEDADYPASWSMAAADIDKNGFTDLLYGSGNGVTFMMASDNGTSFTEVSGPEYVFCQRSNFVDINNDGHLDAFVCHDIDPNVYYLNDGEGNLEFHQSGISEDFPSLGTVAEGGNYGSVWIDYDNDHDIDLFIAKCRGAGSPASINEMHRNNGDGTFTEVAAEINLADGIQTWSSAWGDFDNDGDMDVLVGASSFTAGGHKLMMNDGSGNFIDVTEGSGYDDLNSTSIENVTHDFNNDGYLDVRGAGNVIMINNGDFTFSPETVIAPNGPVGDLDNDGFLDIVSGGTIYYNNGNENNYLKINLLGDSSNAHGIGARVEVYTPLGMQIRDIKSGDGFRYMSSLTAHFGLGLETVVDSIIIYWPSGVITTTLNPEINSSIAVLEEWEEDGGSVGIRERFSNDLLLYPNPAQDQIYVKLPVKSEDNVLLIYDMNGKMVMNTSLKSNFINIKALSAGSYLMRIEIDDVIYQEVFIKN